MKIKQTKTETLEAVVPDPIVSRRSFSKQFRFCNSDGTCLHMSKANHDAMPKLEQERYAENKLTMSMATDYFGPRGPLFCGASPGVCSSHHCPKLKAANTERSDQQVR